ncbi:MAG: response regulator [Chloroflexi bacterium]|nr:MAG: response regulator [Chloroflexota bacterium]
MVDKREKASAGSRILVIDDDPVIRMLIASILERRGYVVETADSVAEALDVLARFTPDLICCDLTMPEQDGLDFLRIRQQMPALKSVPVVVITAVGEEKLLTQALELGAQATLGKPFSRVQLLKLITEYLVNKSPENG